MPTSEQNKTSTAIRRFPTIDSNNLFAVSREVRINHEGEEYRLRITSNNKLIFNEVIFSVEANLFAYLHSINQIYFFGGLRWSNHNFSIIKYVNEADQPIINSPAKPSTPAISRK